MSVATEPARSRPASQQVGAPALARWLVIAGVLVAALVPVLWIVRIALTPPADYSAAPARLVDPVTVQNFRRAWTTAGLGHGFVNSLAIVPLGALGATVLAALGGFGLAKLRIPFRRVVEGLVIAAIGVPLTAIALPLFNQSLTLGYTNSRPALSLVYACIYSAWGTIFLRSVFAAIPDSLVDSARMDGCNSFGTFWRLAVPLAWPALATTVLINLYVQWSDLLLALVLLPRTGSQTLTVSIATLSTEVDTVAPTLAAGAVIASLPIIAVFLGLRGVFRTDVLDGGVK